MKKIILCLLLLFAQSSISQIVLTPFVPDNNYRSFGYAADAFGNEMVITGADYLDITRTYVYVFKKNGNTITQETYFEPSDITPNDNFGSSISLSIDTDFIAASNILNDQVATDAGAVYLYRKVNGNWIFFQKIIAFDGAAGDNFGSDVKIVNNKIFISAINNEAVGQPNSTNSGAIYIYEFNGSTWILSQKLTQTGSISFGNKMKIEGNKLVVRSGSVSNSSTNFFTYNYNGASWNFSSELTASNVLDFDLDNNQLFILKSGVYMPIPNYNQTMDIYDYSSGTWNFNSTLNSLNLQDKFGTNFRVKNNFMLISLNFHALLYTAKTPTALHQKINGTWTFMEYLYGNGPSNQDDFFGSQIALTNDLMLAVAPIERMSPPSMGRAYVVDMALGLNEASLLNITISPNPTTGFVYINNPGEDFKQIDIYQIDGKLIKSIQNDFENISMNEFQSGIYLLKINLTNGFSVSRKVVKI
jgi:hypothetical protein